MRNVIFRASASVIMSIIFSTSLSAEGASGISLKFNISGNVFTSTETFTTGHYPAIDDYGIFDALNEMEFKFDPGLGKSFSGAIGYKASRIVELEIGVGYTSIPMEISQTANYSFYGSTRYVIDSYEYDSEKDASFRYVNVRPAVNINLPTQSTVTPFISIGMNILMAKTEGELDFAMPYVTEDISYYYLWIGEDAHLEPLEYEGSQTTYAIDFGAGLDIEISPTLSINMFGSYLIQFSSLFEDFDELLTDSDAEYVFDLIGYDFKGLKYSGFNFSLGLKMHL